jgi:hypothetical protein
MRLKFVHNLARNMALSVARNATFAGAVTLVALSGCARSTPQQVDDAALRAADADSANWITYWMSNKDDLVRLPSRLLRISASCLPIHRSVIGSYEGMCNFVEDRVSDFWLGVQ